MGQIYQSPQNTTLLIHLVSYVLRHLIWNTFPPSFPPSLSPSLPSFLLSLLPSLSPSLPPSLPPSLLPSLLPPIFSLSVPSFLPSVFSLSPPLLDLLLGESEIPTLNLFTSSTPFSFCKSHLLDVLALFLLLCKGLFSHLLEKIMSPSSITSRRSSKNLIICILSCNGI